MRILLALFLTSTCFAADPCKSGVPVGQRPGPYSFLVATGPQAGQQTCYICDQANKPAAVIFARSLSDATGKLFAKLDAEVPAQKDLGFKVWVTQLSDKAELEKLSKWAKQSGVKNSPVGCFEDVDGPPAYKIAKDADVTVLLFVKQKVVTNFAFREGELTKEKIDEIAKALPTLFEKK